MDYWFARATSYRQHIILFPFYLVVCFHRGAYKVRQRRVSGGRYNQKKKICSKVNMSNGNHIYVYVDELKRDGLS